MMDDDDRPWLYYKLTNEPKGSGELIKRGSYMNLLNELGEKDKMRGSAEHLISFPQ